MKELGKFSCRAGAGGATAHPGRPKAPLPAWQTRPVCPGGSSMRRQALSALLWPLGSSFLGEGRAGSVAFGTLQLSLLMNWDLQPLRRELHVPAFS